MVHLRAGRGLLYWAAAVICGAVIRGGTSLHHEACQPEPLDEIVSALI
jgi:hypothetical protein